MDYPGKKFRDITEASISQAERIIQQNQKDVAAHISLAESYIDLWCYGFHTRDDVLPKAKAAIEKACELDANYGLVHTVQGILLLSDWDWKGAELAFQKAIKIDPNQFKSRHWFALYLAAMGRFEEARTQSEKAIALAPSLGSRVAFSSILYFAHDFEGMVKVLENEIDEYPDYAPGYDWLGMAYVQLKMYDQSIEVYKKAVALSDGLAEIKAGLGHTYGLAGRTVEAKAVLDELVSLSQHYYIPPVQIAFVCLGLGEVDLTIEWLEKAFNQRSWELVFIREEPWFDELHSESRFANLLERINFPAKIGEY